MVLTSCHLLSKLKFAQNNRANTLFGGNLRNYIIIDNTDRGTADDCYSDNDDYNHHILKIMKLKTPNLSTLKKKVLRVG